MFDRPFWQSAFETAQTYDEHVASGTPQQQDAWKRVHAQAGLTEAQRALAASWSRELNVLIVSGVWCGDCAQQCPLIQRIAEAATRRVRLRFIDRDRDRRIIEAHRVNGGDRVPVVIFLAEDFEYVFAYGDRTLARYRALAARQLGPSCPMPGAPVPPDELSATLADWLNEFERAQLLLRLSGRLRQIHND